MPPINPKNIRHLDNGETQGLDVMSELFNGRILMLDGEITPAPCSMLIANMLVLERNDPKAPITLLISSPGGDVHAGLGLIDVMDDLSCPVNTVAYGLVASMASIVLACGSKRSAYPNTQILLHQLMTAGGLSQQSDLDIVALQAASMRARLDNLLAKRTRLDVEEAHALTERDCWCDARKALELGIIDEVIGA